MRLENKYAIEAVLFLSYVLFAMAWVGGTFYMEPIMAQAGIDSYANASLLSGSVTFAKIVGTFAAAALAAKVGLKWAFFAAAVMVVAGWATPYAQQFDWLLASRFLMGLGGALMVVYFNPYVLRYFPPSQRPVVNGLNAVAFNVGTALVLWLMPTLTQWSGHWQTTLSLLSAASALLALLWLLAPEPEQSAGAQQKAAPYPYRTGLADPFNWAYALTYSGLLAFYICLFTFYPQAGFSATKWVIGFGILGTIAGTYYSQRVSKRRPVIRFSGLVITLSAAWMTFAAPEAWQPVAAAVLGFAIFFPISALVTLPQELPGMTPSRITVVFSLFWSISYLVATVVLWVFGLMVDANQGDFTWALVMITAVSLTFFLGSFALPEPSQQAVEAKECPDAAS
ncbi:MFS transporter [Ferrimonas marina]|uniref:Cyanate permease n=1 Tax=Ferrimonas marina TaxID=299255 RepID=A0A1M5QY49_9GAMM|nr:MFS transporter [Ferrimonas marina]SHH18473.1 Cyanate permease [Ferrimonas marina]